MSLFTDECGTLSTKRGLAERGKRRRTRRQLYTIVQSLVTSNLSRAPRSLITPTIVQSLVTPYSTKALLSLITHSHSRASLENPASGTIEVGLPPNPVLACAGAGVVARESAPSLAAVRASRTDRARGSPPKPLWHRRCCYLVPRSELPRHGFISLALPPLLCDRQNLVIGDR